MVGTGPTVKKASGRIHPTRLGRLLRRGGSFRFSAGRRPRRRRAWHRAVPRRCVRLAAAAIPVDGRPGAGLGFVMRETAGLVALLDMPGLGLALPFVGGGGFVATRHGFSPLALAGERLPAEAVS